MEIINLSNIEEIKKKLKNNKHPFIEEIRKYEIEGYHYMKYYRMNTIFRNGILPLNKKGVRIIKANVKSDYSKESDKIERKFRKYEKEELDREIEGRSGCVSFSPSNDQCNNRMQEILDYYGGETIGKYFKDIFDDNMREKLLKMGKPIIVKFYFKYDQLCDRSRVFVEDFLKKLEKNDMKNIEKLKENIENELRIQGGIPANKIQGYYYIIKDSDGNFERWKFHKRYFSNRMN